ncbi:hypothetical protein HPB50_024736 [Hyalomma asiaticum]|uniref:Uncharacterized protein n=1 Tax=Hyalomma asiaticum TaxID=266040 RepID=A0ACB7SII4_HYAAI|nr:hypothetical protein HPB50_024736 [Hyalomma asiaticum]
MEVADTVATGTNTGNSLRLRLQDSRRSWFTLAMCMVMAHTATIGSRSQGAIYVGIREHFGASHGEASFPPSLQSSLCLVGGILTGFLCEVISLRHMSLGCSLVSSVALIVCYFGPTLSFISFFFGVVHGLATSGMFVVASVAVGEYFVRWRATAYSLSSAAKSSHFFTPFVANHIRVYYGPLEIFLLLGALSLNGFVAALLVRTPPWRLPVKSKDVTPACSNPGTSNEYCQTGIQDRRATVTLAEMDDSVTSDVAFAVEPLLQDVPLVQNYVLSNFVLFHLDVTLDRGIDASFAAYLLLAFNLSVVLGSLVIGFVVDRRALSLNATVVLGFCGNAATCEGLVWSRSGGHLLACAVVQGLSCGIMAPLTCPVLIRDTDSESLHLVIGGCHTVMGLVLLSRPSLVGLFRDVLGSYGGIQHIFASLNAFLAIIWAIRLLRPKCTRC